jgi:peptidoglycan/LPS O-acetylase OafA/YrhL
MILPDDRQNNFDLLRLFAALQVATWHMSEHLHLPLITTWAGVLYFQFPGVVVFYGISGFLIAHSLLKNGNLPGYFLRRAVRIYPGLWVCLFLLELACFSTGSFPSTLPFWPQVGWHVSLFVVGSDSYANLIFNWPWTHGHFFKVFPSGVLWTITIELQFYLLIPAIIFVAKRLNRFSFLAFLLPFIGSILVGRYCHQMVLQSYYTNTFELTRLSVLPFLWVFLIGAALQFYWDRIKLLFVDRGLFWLAAYFAYAYYRHWIVRGPIGVDYEIPDGYSIPKTIILVCTIISLAFTFRNAARVLGENDFSYGIYLYHMPIVWFFMLWGVSGQLYLWPAVLIPTLGLAAMSWFCFERRARDWLRRRGKAPRKIVTQTSLDLGNTSIESIEKTAPMTVGVAYQSE